jgi:phage replication-related protein YjqB (UPF0714/DUF867 family)
MEDRYRSFSELAASEVEGRDYRVRLLDRPASPVVVIAPHGGGIERGTTELAGLIAGEEHSLFSFEGLKPRGNRDLHITSHRFDHPASLTMLARCPVAVGVHGCRGERQIYVGGRDLPLRALLAIRLGAQGFAAAAEGHTYPGTHPLNICNRTTRSCGAQLELTWDLRDTAVRTEIARIVASALGEHLRQLALA